MPLSKQHKAQTREKIVRAAGRLFRAHGYDAVSIDTVMGEAGLTRGGFYNHFKTKDALLEAVLREDHGLLRGLRMLPPREVMQYYLDPANLPEVVQVCSFVNFMNESHRHSPAMREAMQDAFNEVIDLLGNGAPNATRKELMHMASRAIGAVTVARNLASDQAKTILQDAWADIDAILIA